MSELLVSVIIPTYKRAIYLSRAINSVLNQTYTNVEVIVVDDNDPKSEWRTKTEVIMEQYKNDTRVNYICHKKNMNGSVARNTGIYNSNGEVICFLDDDDVYLPMKIIKQLTYLLNNEKYKAVYCGWNREGKTVIPTKEGDLSYDILSGKNIIYTNCIMIYKVDAIECGGWDETFRRHQEAAFLMRYFNYGGEIGVISESLIEFDTSDRNNATKNSILYEEQMTHYLNTFIDSIDRFKTYDYKKYSEIYCNRYRGVLFFHIKDKHYKEAMLLYIKMLLKFPIQFNVNIFNYVFSKSIRSLRG